MKRLLGARLNDWEQEVHHRMLELCWVDAYYFPYRAKGNYTESKKKIDGNFKKNLGQNTSSL